MLSLSLGCGAISQVMPKRVTLPRSLPLKVVHDGDSISAANYCFPYLWSSDNSAVPFHNFAVGGSTLGAAIPGSGASGNLWGRVLDVLGSEPSIISIMVGANDGLDGDAQTYFERVMAYTAYLKAQRPGVKVMVCSNTPRDYGTGEESQTTVYNSVRHALDSLYRSAVGNQIDAYAPIARHPALDDAAALSSLFDSGHLHPTGTCHSDHIYPVYAATLNALVDQATAMVPSAFSFNERANVALSTPITGDPVIVGGMKPTANVAVIASGGTAAIGQGAFSASPGQAMNGDAVSPRVLSSDSNSVGTEVDVSIGGRVGTFSASTIAAKPIAFKSFASAVTDTSTTTHSLTIVMPEAGRPVILSVLSGGVDSIVLRDGDGDVVSTGTKLVNAGSTERALWAFDNEISAGEHTLIVTGAIGGTYELTAYIGYLINSVGHGATGWNKDNTFGYHNANSLRMAAEVAVQTGGIGVLWAWSQNGFGNDGANSLVQEFGDQTGFIPSQPPATAPWIICQAKLGCWEQHLYDRMSPIDIQATDVALGFDSELISTLPLTAESHTTPFAAITARRSSNSSPRKSS